MSGNPDRPSSRHTRGSPQSSGKNHAQSSPNLLLCSCLFVSCLVWPALSAGLPAIDECEPLECGGVHNISYPFWIEGRQPPQCGYPAFKLSCKVDAPFIKISGKEYTVAGIFYNNQSFMVASDELSKSNCPVPSHNLSLDATPFYLNPLDRNLSFFLGCPGEGPGYRIDCAAGDDGDRYVVGNPSRSDREEATKNCGSSVSWPYLGDGRAEGDEKYAVLLKRGILLNWNAVDNCSVCTESGGRCRYDLSRESFSCNCSDRPHAVSCKGSIPLPSASQNPRGISKMRRIALGVGAVVAGFLLAGVLCLLVYKRKRMSSRTGPSTRLFRTTSSDPPSPKDLSFNFSNTVSNVPLLDFKSVKAATSNFSDENKLGEGGFGPVYKGRLLGGGEIAVKRLSKLSKQGHQEFSNEVRLIAKLQHKNLVRLLGSCAHKDEKLLIYEYMPNKSLDKFIFDLSRSAELSWSKRFGIIQGIAHGLLYLHHYSRMRVIHRDLKTGNILLDGDMNPKISDFGLARIFGADQMEANTRKVVGTFGYMSPEYASQGLFSEKSDVFSFGVILLEIITGERSTSYYPHKNSQTLLGYVWQMWEEDRVMELLDPSMGSSATHTGEVLKCTQLGLLCVQHDAVERPTMSYVVSSLSSETCVLPNPGQPAFTIGRDSNPVRYDGASRASVNGLTMSSARGR